MILVNVEMLNKLAAYVSLNLNLLQNVIGSNVDNALLNSINSAWAYIAKNEDPAWNEKKYIDDYIG